MIQYRIADEARADLEEIWLYIAQDDAAAADHFVERIVGKFQMLSNSPGVGRARDELAPSLRSFPVGQYVIFYQSTEDYLEIVRVLHGARDLPPLFG
jgi:toxin ParE1/3/4